MEPSGILSERSLTAATLPKTLVTFRSWIAFIEAPARTRQNPLLTYLQTQSIEHCKGSGVAPSLREIILSHQDPVTGRRVAHFHELSCRVATQRRTKICASAYAVTRLGGQRLLSLHGAVSPPMSLARDADLAQRTVALCRGAREGETFLSVS